MLVGLLFASLAFLGGFPTVYLLLNAHLSRRAGAHAADPFRTPPDVRSVTIVVPVHAQRPDRFGACVASVAAQGSPFVVVGDASDEPYRSLTEASGGRFLHLRDRVGKKGALAAALEGVETELVLLVDSDTVLPSGAVGDLAAHFAPGVGGVGANLTVKETGRPVAHLAEFVERAREVVLRAMSSRGSVLYLDGACTMFRTDAVRAFVRSSEFQDLRVLGRPSPLGDDWMLTDHLLRSGYATVKAYDVRVVTPAKETLAEFVEQNVRWSRSNWIRFGRYLTGRGPGRRGAFFTFELVGTYALPLIAIANLLARVPFLFHHLGSSSLSPGSDASAILRAVVGLPRSLAGTLAHLSLTVTGAFASGAFLGAVLRSSRAPSGRTVAYGTVALALLFAATVYGLLTFWKRPRWGPLAVPGARRRDAPSADVGPTP